jgi:hypothetical protein
VWAKSVGLREPAGRLGGEWRGVFQGFPSEGPCELVRPRLTSVLVVKKNQFVPSEILLPEFL